MIKELKKGMYLYSVKQKLFRDTYYIKRDVLIDVDKLMIGDSKKHCSWRCTLPQDTFDRIYWETPEEAFNSWKKNSLKRTKEQLAKLNKEYKDKKKELQDENKKISSIDFEGLKVESNPVEWEPCLW